MSIISPPDAPPASGNAVGASRSQWSFARLFSRAIVILIGIAVGWVIAVFIGLATGWIEIQLC
jgi:hypothetical protein